MIFDGDKFCVFGEWSCLEYSQFGKILGTNLPWDSLFPLIATLMVT